MHHHVRLLLVALAGALTLSLATGTASASRSIELRGGPRVTAEGLLTFEEGAGSFRIICLVALRRTITSRIPKTGGTLFGKLTGIAIDRGETVRSPSCEHDAFIRAVHDITPLAGAGRPCRHAETAPGILTWDCSTAESRLWKLIYDSFQGTLPGISGINFHIQGFRLKFVVLGAFGETIECLYEGNVFGLFVVRAEGTIRDARLVKERTNLANIEGPRTCPGRGTLEIAGLTLSPLLTIALL
jgi:hypothetical protein